MKVLRTGSGARAKARRAALAGTLGCALAAAALLAASGASAQEPGQGGTLIAAFSADPAGFDPVRGPSGMSHVVIEQVYSTLLNLDPDAEPYPGVAESWEVSDDG